MNLVKRVMLLMLNDSQPQEIDSFLTQYDASQSCADVIAMFDYLMYVHTTWCCLNTVSLQMFTRWLSSRPRIVIVLLLFLEKRCRMFGASCMFYFEETCLEEKAYSCILKNIDHLWDLPKEKYDRERARKIMKGLSIRQSCSSEAINQSPAKCYRRIVSDNNHIERSLQQALPAPPYFKLIGCWKPQHLSYGSKKVAVLKTRLNILQPHIIWVASCSELSTFPASNDRKLIVTDHDLIAKNVAVWNVYSARKSWNGHRIAGFSKYFLSLLLAYGTQTYFDDMLSSEVDRVRQRLCDKQ